MKFEIEYYEYECGKPCSPSGCTGHVSEQPVGVTINGVTFWVDGYEGGDFPSPERRENEEVRRVVLDLEQLCRAGGQVEGSSPAADNSTAGA